MAGVELRVAPVAGPPVHHVAVVLVTCQVVGLAAGIESGKRRDACLLHRRIAVRERLPKRPLDIRPHFGSQPRRRRAFAAQLVIARVASGKLEAPGVLVESPPHPRRVLEIVRVRFRKIVVRLPVIGFGRAPDEAVSRDRKSTRLNSSHLVISYAVFCLKKKKKTYQYTET